ncbi:conserved hypothetical protein [Theileria equi strain WA]|uniref:Splicing factor Cactin n=1 Tax=Theileria equi strain WA TaxID=1537102 RepID=L1LBX4_THEEQ|nr:conserved hypothetical protein [Theileria equi strain WA]EKX72745.1 conserved hypothetical protein [Theileria equi strain WA]|eukprot:XP_004832197.1 conserved hypothetical protein [Theileria equi strain WA]
MINSRKDSFGSAKKVEKGFDFSSKFAVYSETPDSSTYDRNNGRKSDSDSNKRKVVDNEELYAKRSQLLHQHFGYTDESNPFGDKRLAEPFVWEKKGKAKHSVEDVRSKVEEIKEVKHRREQHEIQKSMLEEYRQDSHRGKQEEDYQEWESKEREFNLKQIIAKSAIRVADGREKLIDKFVLSINPNNIFFTSPVDVNDMFSKMDLQDAKDAMEIIEANVELLKDQTWLEYFKALETIVKNKFESSYESFGIAPAVSEKIDQILSKKSLEDLDVYEREIKKRLAGTGIVDTNFWEAALSRIPFFRACRIVTHVISRSNPQPTHTSAPITHTPQSKSSECPSDSLIKPTKSVDYEKFIKFTKLDEDEEVFDSRVELSDSSDASLITPKYYNRIIKNFEWTKYNLAHYDTDNPPPKLVQGYKFNIFYPELKGKIPKWKLQKDGKENDTALIRFIAGHPYKDIAFRVINKEWNTYPNKGFKNFFDNGILHLYFNFKKVKYRR